MALRMAAVALLALAGAARGAEDGLARTPPMGWRSWNAYGGDINQAIMITAAEAVAQLRDAAGKPANSSVADRISLLDLGYNDVGLDDNWQKCGAGVSGSFHDEDGVPIVNLKKFPDLKAMTDAIHKLGLRAGWYGNNCICREAKDLWANQSHYVGDVKAHFDYGFDSTKLDGCGAFLDLDLFYKLFNRDGSSTGTMMVENCHWGRTVPTLDHCPYHMYRSSKDIVPNWKSMFSNLQTTRKFQGEKPLSRPGCWAYPDMLEVGRLATAEEDRAHFAAWAITSSPLILGHRITDPKTTEKIWPIISNKLAISINQDWAGHPGRMIQETNGAGGRVIQAWAKPLSGNNIAVLFINDNAPGGDPEEVQIPLEALNLSTDSRIVAATDVWSGIDCFEEVLRASPLGAPAGGADNQYLTVQLAGHDSVFLHLSYADADAVLAEA